jgi:hexosaminidase
LTACSEDALRHAESTYAQLLDAAEQAGDGRVAVPAVRIADAPRFGWRGIMLDVARHFMPKEFVLKVIDVLALHRLNTLHFYLTDDQGWRVEIEAYPKLTGVGAWRAATMVGKMSRGQKDFTYDGRRHGGFYTKADLREIVAYAAGRSP